MVEIRYVSNIFSTDAKGSTHAEGEPATVKGVGSITVTDAASVADYAASVGTHACGRFRFGENGRW